jgi:CheY-like chemotaxis protein
MIPMKKHFLLAEDDEEDISLFEEAIVKADLQIELLAVSNYDRILSALNADELPDLIILDNSLPGKTSLECIGAIRARFNSNELPVIMLSTAIPPNAKAKGYEAGFNLLLEKPVSFFEIQTLLKKLYAVNWKQHPPLSVEEFNSLDTSK